RRRRRASSAGSATDRSGNRCISRRLRARDPHPPWATLALWFVTVDMHNNACFGRRLAENAPTCILLHIITMTKQGATYIPGGAPVHSGAGDPGARQAGGADVCSAPVAAVVLLKAFDPSEAHSASMVAAGAAVLWESGLIEESRGSVERVISEIYLA